MNEEKPYAYLIPYSKLGKWSIVFIVLFGLLMTAFYPLIDSGQSGEEGGFFDNLWLAIPFTSAAIFGSALFIVGLVAAIIQEERSIFVLISILVGLVIFLMTLVIILPFE